MSVESPEPLPVFSALLPLVVIVFAVGLVVIVVQTVIGAIGGSGWYWAGGIVLAFLTWRFRRIWWR